MAEGLQFDTFKRLQLLAMAQPRSATLVSRLQKMGIQRRYLQRGRGGTS